MMDQFCSRCGAMDGFEPDDHACMDNLVKERKQIHERLNSSGTIIEAMELDDLIKIERELSANFKKQQDVVIWFSDQVKRAERERDAAYGKKQNSVTYINQARAEIKKRMEPVS